MTNTFIRSMHSLEADNARLAQVGLSAGAVLLIVWTLWFFTMPITIYATSSTATVEQTSNNYEVIAEFPATTDLSQFEIGQNAVIRIDAFPSINYGTVSGSINTVDTQNAKVIFLLNPSTNPKITLRSGLNASVAIEVDHLTPAQLLIQAIGSN